MTTIQFDYQPTERQAFAHTALVDEMLYGGAAGGGKSRFLRAEFIMYALEVPGSAQGIFRRFYPDLELPGGMIPMLKAEMPPGIATYNAVNHRWTFNNGSTITLAAIARDDDVYKFMGSEFQRIAFDEGTQFQEFQYLYLRSRLRASGKIRERLEELGRRPSSIITANPGGRGHAWVKARFIDPAPPNTVFRPTRTLDEPNPGTRLFVPAKLTDNAHVDKDYIDKLRAQGEDTRRALLDGDWDIYEGQRFKDFRTSVHVIDPSELPLSLGGIPRAVGVDYGMSAPFAAVWGALLPDGMVYIYRELSAKDLSPEQQIEAILAAEMSGERTKERPIPLALDPSTWARNPRKPARQDGLVVDNQSPDQPPDGSIADAYWQRIGTSLEKGRNDRRAGAALVSEKLRVREDGLPRLLISESCRYLIRTLPTLPRSPRDPEDVDTTADDHIYDALRYLLMHFASRYGEAMATEERIRRREDPRLRGLRSGVVTVDGPDLATSGF